MKNLIIFAAAFTSVVLSQPSAQATSITQRSFSDVTQGSELVFEGTVVGIRTEGEYKNIRTLVSFEIIDILKGSYPGDEITLSFLGGKSRGKTMKVGSMKYPKMGEHGVYFVRQLEGSHVHPLKGWSQGHYIVRHDGQKNIVQTTNGKIVTAVSTEKSKSSDNAFTLSKGVASGIETGPQNGEAISLSSFKDKIQSIK
ncbi:MAG: hypothetical protein OIF38_09365 [Cellvibrionaceae bacterium]|nr:hypothetical protein [Cellvibrionaceae bacterium]